MRKKVATSKRREALKAFMKRRNLNVTDWCAQADVPRTTLYSYLSGKTESLTGRNEEKLAEAAGVTVSELFQEKGVNLIPLVGRIGAGAIVYPFDGDEGVMGYVEAPPEVAPAGLIAYEIDGFSMPPFKPGHKIFAKADQAATPESCLNSMCIAQIQGGPRLFKILRRGYEAGTYNLESLDGQPPIENARLAWVVPVIAASFT